MLSVKSCYYYGFVCLLGAFFFAGCSQPIRTLQALGVEKDAQAAQVKRRDSEFELLLKDIGKGRLKMGASRQEIVARYGNPVLEIVARQQDEVAFLYRKGAEFFNTTKVYLTFDKQGILKKIDVEEPDAKQNN
ncbi:MAG: hypothetical protein ABIC68_07780 [Candidatus Omnitrophota bacterium]